MKKEIATVLADTELHLICPAASNQLCLYSKIAKSLYLDERIKSIFGPSSKNKSWRPFVVVHG